MAEVGAEGHTLARDALMEAASVIRRRRLERRMVERMRPRHDRHHRGGIGHRARERTDMRGEVSRAERRIGDAAEARLQAVDAAEVCRHAHRSRTVAALVQRSIARRGGSCGTGRRGAGIVSVLPGVVRDARERAAADAAPAELRQGRLAERDRARLLQPLDIGRVEILRRVRRGLRAAPQRHADHRGLVLEGNGNAVQRPERGPAHERRLRRARRLHRAVGVEPGEGVDLWLDLVDTGQHRLHQLDRREALLPDHRGEDGGRLVEKIGVRHRVGAPSGYSPKVRR